MTIYKSEIKKAEKAIEKTTGVKCDVTGAGWKEEGPDFTEVKFEMCNKQTGRFVGTVIMQLVMFDRRRSWVSNVIA